jgi:two-component system CheB/CheR fusion protein
MSSQDAGLEALLEVLHERRGFDFTGYKRPTLQRRILKRMGEVGVEDFASYQDVLEVDPREYTALFNTILINVTGFFRDPEAWDHVRDDVLARLLEDRDPESPLRIWCAGCSSGEEPYTLVMLLCEALGEEELRRRVKIYATDVDEDALQTARRAVYSEERIAAVPDAMRERYFAPVTGGFAFRPDLRRCVIFGRNDLVQDAPISRVDLLVSRNVLMYFTAEAQARILERFNFALRPAGFLFLGRSEMLITHTDLFSPHDIKWRVFRPADAPRVRERAVSGTPGPMFRAVAGGARIDLRADAAALSPVPQVVVDRTGFVVDVNSAARRTLGLVAADVGRLFQDLEISYRLGDLRSALDRAYVDGTAVEVRGVQRAGAGDQRTFDVLVTPVPGEGERALGAAITFADVTALVRLREDYGTARRELETAYEELQSTVEELETTNEELQSTNEELETTNEELQATNEELETMNEELRSTNDELETMNDEQGVRGRELDTLNVLLESILASLEVAVAVADRDGQVEVWNEAARELWGLREDETVGRALLSLDMGLPVEVLAGPLRRATAEDGVAGDAVVDAVDRRGRAFSCALRVLPLRSAAQGLRGAIVLMADERVSGRLPFSGGALAD